MSKNLLQKTLELTRVTREPVGRICQEVGVSERWYYKLMAGDVPDPSVNRVQRLHDYLAACATTEQPPAAQQPTNGAA